MSNKPAPLRRKLTAINEILKKIEENRIQDSKENLKNYKEELEAEKSFIQKSLKKYR